MTNSSKHNDKMRAEERFTIVMLWDGDSPVRERSIRILDRWGKTYQDVCDIIVFYSRPIDRTRLVQKYRNIKWVRLEEESVNAWNKFARHSIQYVQNQSAVYISPYVIPHFFDMVVLANGARNKQDNTNTAAVMKPQKNIALPEKYRKPLYFAHKWIYKLNQCLGYQRYEFLNTSAHDVPVDILETAGFNTGRLKNFLESGAEPGETFSAGDYKTASADYRFIRNMEKSFYGAGKSRSFSTPRSGWFASYRVMAKYLSALIRYKKPDKTVNAYVWVMPAAHLAQTLLALIFLWSSTGGWTLLVFYYFLLLLYVQSGFKTLNLPAKLGRTLIFMIAWFYV